MRILAIAALLSLMCAGVALATSEKSSGGGSHGSGTHATGKAKSANTEFVHKSCTTKACWAKHPSGSYAIRMVPKKRGS